MSFCSYVSRVSGFNNKQEMQKCLHPALFAFNKLNIRGLRSVCTPALCLHFTCTAPTQHLHYTCTYTTATYHNIGRWKELSEQPNILPPHTHTPPWHNRKHYYAWVCKYLVQAGVYTKTTTAYTLENNDYQRVTTKSARCRQNRQTNI